MMRYLVSGWVQRLDPWNGFPLGTFAVNFVGSSLLGFLAGLSESRFVFPPAARLFLFIGVLGGFTTYSTFTYETLALLREGEYGKAGANVIGTLFLCLTGAWVGYQTGSTRIGAEP